MSDRASLEWGERSIDRARRRRSLESDRRAFARGLAAGAGADRPVGRASSRPSQAIDSRARQDARAGIPFDHAVNAHNDRIPPHLRGLVMAGMRSGEMGDLLDQFRDYFRVGTELKRKLWLSLAYPVLTISIAVALFIFICVFVVSQFESIYRDFGIPLPAITLALLVVARAVNSTWLSAAIVIAVFVRRSGSGSSAASAATEP